MKTWNSINGLLRMVYPIKTSTDSSLKLTGLAPVVQLMVVLGLLTSAAQAADNKLESQEQQAELPELELLEFLGRYETDSGEWMDPTEFLTDEFEQLLTDAELQTRKQAHNGEVGDSKNTDHED